ncbi:hypothetical protein AGDE_17166 [Angomonas deanei]|nr:hypothetical protein AGDE_17166 [Angomonas deanei]|eukprot:EPY15124.1 hypothetical protein AGDE_17166 [Angomonas deanei]
MSFGSVTSVSYAVANARYLTQEELKELDLEGMVEHHTLVSGHTPTTTGLDKKWQEILTPTPELHIRNIVNESFTALQGSPLHSAVLEAQTRKSGKEKDHLQCDT